MIPNDISGLMEFLYRHRAPSLPPSALADIFDRLVWCLDDNGDALLREREAWLLSEDRARVEISLAMEGVFPFKNNVDMEKAFSMIESRWPDLAPRCAEWRTKRAILERRA